MVYLSRTFIAPVIYCSYLLHSTILQLTNYSLTIPYRSSILLFIFNYSDITIELSLIGRVCVLVPRQRLYFL